jgi:hypothetical protein
MMSDDWLPQNGYTAKNATSARVTESIAASAAEQRFHADSDVAKTAPVSCCQ